MKRVLVQDSDGLVANVIELEGDSDWTPPDGHSLVDAENASPGDTWDGERIIKASPPPRSRLDDLHDKLASNTIGDDELREMLRLERGL